MVAGRDDADLRSVLQLHRITGARDGLVLDLDTDQLADDLAALLGQEGFLADEVLVILAEHSQSGHHRADVGAELVAVQRQAGLEAEGVAAAQAAGLDAGRDEAVPQVHGAFRGGVQLEAVLAGVPHRTPSRERTVPMARSLLVPFCGSE